MKILRCHCCSRALARRRWRSAPASAYLFGGRIGVRGSAHAGADDVGFDPVFSVIWALWFGWRAVAAAREPRRVTEHGVAASRCTVTCRLLNPYLRAHGFLFSPLFLCCWARCGSQHAAVFSRLGKFTDQFFQALENPPGIALVICAAGGGTVGGTHLWHILRPLGELLAAKLRFLNVKPEDPALLTFNQRILWVPALHSATWGLTFALFPAILPAVALRWSVWLAEKTKNAIPIYRCWCSVVLPPSSVIGSLSGCMFFWGCSWRRCWAGGSRGGSARWWVGASVAACCFWR